MMTATALLGWIVAALVLQLLAGVGVAVLRRRAVPGPEQPQHPPVQAEGSARAWPGWRDFRVERRAFEDTLQSQCSFYLQPLDGLPLPAFKPGQFLTFSLDVGPPSSDTTATGCTVTRCYSLSGCPEPTRYRVTIKRVPAPADRHELQPGLSSNHFHDHVQPGDILRVKAPAGHFFIDPDPTLPVVLIGGGIGITPMMSMLLWCAKQQPQRPVHLFYGLRNGGDHAFKAPLQALAAALPALHLHIVYSRPDASDVQGQDYHHAGHVDVNLLRRTLPAGRHAFYVCGPPAMMQALLPALAAWGVPAADIHAEAFGPASARVAGTTAAATAASTFEVTFQQTGRTLPWQGQDASLLDFALRHGIEVEHGCRSGGCGTCETRLLDGKVTYDHNPDHDVAPGHCLLCVGRPATSLVLEA